jgi:hypothetical protein
MIRNVKRTWYEVWGNEIAQNQILKALLLFLLALIAVETAAIVMLGLRRPFVVAVTDSATRALTPTPPSRDIIEREVKRVISQYAKAHHEWEWNSIESRIKEASAYVHPDFEKAFNKANTEQIRIAKDKKVSQKFYFTEPALQMGEGRATITGDRILIIDGLRATNLMTLEIEFRLGTRNAANPEGVYVTAERLISQAQGK